MPIYPVDVSKAIEASARARFVRGLPIRKPRIGTDSSGFTVGQFREAAALYKRRAKQTSVPRERREYEALARRFGEEAENHYSHEPATPL